MASLENLFVKTPKGFGKVKKVDKSKEEVNVELFHSIARRVEVAFPSSQIDRSHPLPHQIAAYEEKDGIYYWKGTNIKVDVNQIK